MSVEAISLVLNHSRAKATTKLVLVGIANHHGDGGSWPTTRTLARYAATSERTVRRCVAELVELGEIVVHVNGGGTHLTPNDRRPNRYEIVLRPAVENPSNGGTHVSTRGSNGRTPPSEREDTQRRDGRTPVSTEPSMNHQVRPGPGRAAFVPVENLPAGVASLRLACSEHDDLATVRWTRLTAEHVAELEQLVDAHGIERLIRSALGQTTPRFVQAYLTDWRAMAVPVAPAPEDLGPPCDTCGRGPRACRKAAARTGDPHDYIPRSA